MAVSRSTAAKTANAAAAASTQVSGVNALVGMLTSVVPQSAANGVLDAYVAEFKKILEKTPGTSNISVIPVDKQRAQMSVSVIAIVHKEGRQAAVFNYIVEATAGEIAPEEFKRHGAPDIQLPRAPGSLYNLSDMLWTRVKELVAVAIEGVDELIDAGGAQLHKEVEPSDTARLQATLNRATNATASILKESAPMNLAQLTGLAFDVKADYPRGNIEDSQGLPVRAGFKLDINARDLGANNNDPVGVSTTQLATMSGYVDLQYSGPVQIPLANGTVQMSTQMFVPRLVLTSTTTQHPRIFPELQLLSLACAAALVNRNSWMGALEPSYNDDGVHSLAGMGLELGAVVDTADVNWNLYSFLTSTVHLDRLNYYLHINEADDLTWLMAMFVDAANGKPDAYNYIVSKADTLTNGIFSTLFQGGQIVIKEDDKAIMGYWCDQRGNKRDLREIDQVAFANLVGSANQEKAFAFTDTFNPEKGDLVQRLATRMALLREVLSGNMVFKGYAACYRVAPEFIQALYQAVLQVGIPLNLNQWVDGYQAVSRVNNSLIAATGLNQASLTQGWSTGRTASGVTMGSGFRGAGQGRYGR